MVQARQNLVKVLLGEARQVEEEPVEAVGLEEAEESDFLLC